MMRVDRNKKTMMKKTPKRLRVAVNPSVAFMEQDGVKKNSAGKDGAQGIWQINRKGGRQQKEENKEKKKNLNKKLDPSLLDRIIRILTNVSIPRLNKFYLSNYYRDG